MNTPLIDEHAARAAGCCGICGEAVHYGRRACPECREMLNDIRKAMPDDEIETIRQCVREVRAAKWN